MNHLSKKPNNTPTWPWPWLFLLSLMLLSYHYTHRSSAWSRPILAVLALFLAAALVVVAARATMVTWITVLVLLAFSGMRRKVLVRHGAHITAEVAMYLAKVVLSEKGLVAVACASLLSFCLPLFILNY